MIFKNRLKHLKRKCFSVLRQKQSCSHEVKDGCKNLQRFSFLLLKPFCLSSEQGLKDKNDFKDLKLKRCKLSYNHFFTPYEHDCFCLKTLKNFRFKCLRQILSLVQMKGKMVLSCLKLKQSSFKSLRQSMFTFTTKAF